MYLMPLLAGGPRIFLNGFPAKKLENRWHSGGILLQPTILSIWAHGNVADAYGWHVIIHDYITFRLFLLTL